MLIHHFQKNIKSVIIQVQFKKQNKIKQYQRTFKEVNDQLYESLFKKQNYREDFNIKKLKIKKIESQEDKFKRKVEKQVERDKETMILSRNEIDKIIGESVDSFQRLIMKVREGKLDEEEWEKSKKELRLMGVERVVELTNEVRRKQQEGMKVGDWFWNPVLNHLHTHSPSMNIKQIADIVYNLAYLNRKDTQFFKLMENLIFQQEDDFIPLIHINKLLYGFSFSDQGSATLYNKISKTILIAQNELPLLQLSKYAYYFSKATDNIKGGFGVYQAAEKIIGKRMKELNFSETIRLAENMLEQNLGSNKFQSEIEQQLLDKFPSDVSVSQLVCICKCTSRHRFNESALLNKIHDLSVNLIGSMSNQQILTVLWSFSRSARGSPKLYSLLEEQVLLRINMFNLRAISYIIEGFSLYNYKSAPLMHAIHQRFLSLSNPQLLSTTSSTSNTHYILKIIMALNRLQQTRSPFFTTILSVLNSQNQSITINQFINLLYTIAKCDQQEFLSIFNSIFLQQQSNILKSLSFINILDLSKLLYCFAYSNLSNHQQIFSIIIQNIHDINQIPKSIFCDAFWAFITLKQFKKAAKFLPIIKSLGNFGDIKYFFDHENYIKLVWCCFITQIFIEKKEVEEQLSLDLQQWQIFKESILDINPNTLKIQALKMWIEILSFIRIFIDIDENTIYQSINQISQESIQEIIKNQTRIIQRENTLNQIYNIEKNLKQQLQMKNKIYQEDYSLIINFADDFTNYLNLAYVDKQIKIGILIVDENNYLFQQDKENQQYSTSLELMIRILKHIYEWKIFIFDYNKFIQMDQYSINSFIDNQFLPVILEKKQGRKKRNILKK